MRLLLVEDNHELARWLTSSLTGDGYTVDWLADGAQADQALQQESYALVILDLSLPGQDGLEVLRRLRSRGQTLPVLVVTARAELDDRVTGLNLGADDYLLKPFDFAELLARIRTLLRRNRTQASGNHSIADLIMDASRRTVSRSGKKIHLSTKEFVLLELLLQRTGEVLPRNLLSSLVWNINFESDTNVIDVAVRRLRSKVDDDFTPKLIHTVRGIGYVLEIREE